MNPLALIPYALAAYGGIQGYQGARQQGVGAVSYTHLTLPTTERV